MKTKEGIAEVGGKKCKDLVCPWCGGEVFHVGVEDRERGHIGAYCDYGYGIGFSYNISKNKLLLVILETALKKEN